MIRIRRLFRTIIMMIAVGGLLPLFADSFLLQGKTSSSTSSAQGTSESIPLYILTQQEFTLLTAQATLVQQLTDMINTPATKQALRTQIRPMLQTVTDTPDSYLDTLIVPLPAQPQNTQTQTQTSTATTVQASPTQGTADTSTNASTSQSTTLATTSNTLATTSNTLATTSNTLATTSNTLATTSNAAAATAATATQSTAAASPAVAIAGTSTTTTLTTSQIATSSSSVTQTPTPTNYTVTQQSLDALKTALNIVDYSPLPIAKLQPLVDTVFYQNDVWRLALEMAGFASLTQSDKDKLETLFTKTVIPAGVQAQAIQWSESSCGCAQTVSDTDLYQNFIVGYYPYWLAGTPQNLDFHLYSRIQYFTHTLDTNNQIRSPLNWQNSKPYTQFVDQAHRYRVKVDAVVSNEIWSEENLVFDDQLVSEIDALVKQKREGDLLNQLKPYLSLGTSPERTMADGVTLHLNLRRLDEAAQQRFLTFIPKLKQTLNGTQQAQPSDEYYVNLSVPAYYLVVKPDQGFYTLDNLLAISPYINLLFITIDRPEVFSKPLDTMETLKSIRDLLDKHPNVQEANNLLRKIVPLVTTTAPTTTSSTGSQASTTASGNSSTNAVATTLQNAFDYTEWNYSGIGLWSLPLTPDANQVATNSLQAAGIPPTGFQKTISSLSAQVCNFMCPHRWLVRVALFVGVVVWLVYMLLVWTYTLSRKWYFPRYALILFAALAVTFLFALICDPYWKEQQAIILMLFFSIGLIAMVVIVLHKRRVAKFP